jgi:hypothetical protein
VIGRIRPGHSDIRSCTPAAMTSLPNLVGRGRRRVPGLMATLMALALFSTAGCSDNASSSNAPDASEGDTDASTGDDAMQPTDAGQAPDADAKDPDAGSRLCGSRGTEECSDTEYCDYPDNECGRADGAGTSQCPETRSRKTSPPGARLCSTAVCPWIPWVDPRTEDIGTWRQRSPRRRFAPRRWLAWGRELGRGGAGLVIMCA